MMKKKPGSKLLQEIRGYRPSDKILLFGLVFLFFAQLAVLIYFNLTQLAAHSGFDSSWAYLKTALIWRDKTIYNPSWAETTGLGFDSPTLLAALLYGLTGNVYVGYGLANSVILICILLCVSSIFKHLDLNRISCLVTLNLVICPFLLKEFGLSNDLSYFGNLLGGAAHYSVRMLVILLISRQIILFRKNNKWDFWGILSLPLCFVVGASSGVYLLLILLIPFLAFEVEQVFLKNDWKILLKKEAAFCYLLILLMILGREFTIYVLHFAANDATKTWTPYPAFWQNFGAVVQGFLKLTNALPMYSNESILSNMGYVRLFPLFLVFMMGLSLVFSAKAALKDWMVSHGFVLFCLNVVLLNFLSFGLFNVQYGSYIFEERYLVSTFLFIAILVGWFINQLPAKKILTWTLCAAMLVSVAVIDVFSDGTYMRIRNDTDEMDEIVRIAEQENAGIVYASGGEKPRLLSRNMRAYDLNRLYKAFVDEHNWFFHWGDYTDGDRNDEYSGTTLLICMADDGNVPEWLLEAYEPLTQVNDLLILKCDHNPVDFH